MSALQQGRAANAAGACRFDNPHPMGSAEFASWRHGWDRAEDDKRMARHADGLSAPGLTGAGIEHVISNANRAYARGLGLDLGGI